MADFFFVFFYLTSPLPIGACVPMADFFLFFLPYLPFANRRMRLRAGYVPRQFDRRLQMASPAYFCTGFSSLKGDGWAT